MPTSNLLGHHSATCCFDMAAPHSYFSWREEYEADCWGAPLAGHPPRRNIVKDIRVYEIVRYSDSRPASAVENAPMRALEQDTSLESSSNSENAGSILPKTDDTMNATSKDQEEPEPASQLALSDNNASMVEYFIFEVDDTSESVADVIPELAPQLPTTDNTTPSLEDPSTTISSTGQITINDPERVLERAIQQLGTLDTSSIIASVSSNDQMTTVAPKNILERDTRLEIAESSAAKSGLSDETCGIQHPGDDELAPQLSSSTDNADIPVDNTALQSMDNSNAVPVKSAVSTASRTVLSAVDETHGRKPPGLDDSSDSQPDVSPKANSLDSMGHFVSSTGSNWADYDDLPDIPPPEVKADSKPKKNELVASPSVDGQDDGNIRQPDAAPSADADSKPTEAEEVASPSANRQDQPSKDEEEKEEELLRSPLTDAFSDFTIPSDGDIMEDPTYNKMTPADEERLSPLSFEDDGYIEVPCDIPDTVFDGSDRETILAALKQSQAIIPVEANVSGAQDAASDRPVVVTGRIVPAVSEPTSPSMAVSSLGSDSGSMVGEPLEGTAPAPVRNLASTTDLETIVSSQVIDSVHAEKQDDDLEVIQQTQPSASTEIIVRHAGAEPLKCPFERVRAAVGDAVQIDSMFGKKILKDLTWYFGIRSTDPAQKVYDVFFRFRKFLYKGQRLYNGVGIFVEEGSTIPKRCAIGNASEASNDVGVAAIRNAKALDWPPYKDYKYEEPVRKAKPSFSNKDWVQKCLIKSTHTFSPGPAHLYGLHQFRNTIPTYSMVRQAGSPEFAPYRRTPLRLCTFIVDGEDADMDFDDETKFHQVFDVSRSGDYYDIIVGDNGYYYEYRKTFDWSKVATASVSIHTAAGQLLLETIKHGLQLSSSMKPYDVHEWMEKNPSILKKKRENENSIGYRAHHQAFRSDGFCDVDGMRKAAKAEYIEAIRCLNWVEIENELD